MREDIKRRIEQIGRGEVPEGYEKSSDGPAPKDWKVKRLGEILKIKYGKDQKDVEKKDGMYPILATGGVIGRTDRYLYDKPSVLIGRKGTIDRPMYIETPFWTVDTLFYSIIRDNNSVRFVHYLISSMNWKKYSEATTLPSLSSSVIEGIKAAIPESDEQAKIAEILSTCDRVIELKKKLIEEKKKVKKWFMQTLLTGMIRVKDIENRTPYEELKKRIEQIRNGEAPEGYVETEDHIIPKSWSMKPLNELRNRTDRYSLVGGPFGSDLQTKDYTDDGVRIVQLQNIGDGEFLNDYEIYTSEEKADQLKNCNIYAGDIIIAKMPDPLARACLIPDLAERYLMCSDGIRLSVNEKENNSRFVLYQINGEYFRRQVQRKGNGSTRLRIGLNDLRSMEIPTPCKEEQTRISDILSNADKEIDLLNKDLEQWELKKKSLMQLLLTGIVRIKA